MSIKCDSCGAELDESAEYCDSCGKTTIKGRENNIKISKNNIEIAKNKEKQQKENNRKLLKTIGIVSLLIIILVPIFAGLHTMAKNKESEKRNEITFSENYKKYFDSGNIGNLGKTDLEIKNNLKKLIKEKTGYNEDDYLLMDYNSESYYCVMIKFINLDTNKISDYYVFIEKSSGNGVFRDDNFDSFTENMIK